jgi:hypothetical protein
MTGCFVRGHLSELDLEPKATVRAQQVVIIFALDMVLDRLDRLFGLFVIKVSGSYHVVRRICERRERERKAEEKKIKQDKAQKPLERKKKRQSIKLRQLVGV